MISFSHTLSLGLSEKIFEDAELLVAQNGVVTTHESVGQHATQPQAVFDLASLTKPLCMATLCMIFTDQKKFLVDDTVDKFFSTKNLKGVALRDLLNHTSGLIDWAPLYEEFMPDKIDHTKNLTRMTDRILNDPTLMKNPRGTTDYSCLGYILLTAIVEKIGGAPLDKLFYQLTDWADPTDQLFFVPHASRFTLHASRAFVPSSFCPTRNRINVGEVNDLNAYALGGVSGNAGLFGSATAVHNALCELRLAKLGQSKIILQQVFHSFCTRDTRYQILDTSFLLGFDTPTPGSSQSGTLFSPNTIGHLSYTGCSFWWDLEKDFWVIFLTNALLRDPEKKLFAKFRPNLHDLILRQIT